MSNTNTDRADYEAWVEKVTGRSMDYHRRGQTTGLDFAFEAWQEGRRRPARRDELRLFDLAVAKEMPPANFDSYDICDYFAERLRDRIAAIAKEQP